MKFTKVAEAYNYYRTQTVEVMEKRAAEIGKVIDTDVNADVEALNIELKGIKEAKDDVEARSSARKTLSFLEGSEKTTTFDASNVFESKEYRSAFFKALLNQKLNADEKRAFDVAAQIAEKRADAFNTASNSAAVLPTETLNEVIKKARTMGGLMAECRAFSMPTKISIPIGTPSTKAAWHTEAASVDSESVTVAAVSFDGYEIMKVFSISEKARKMSVSAFESYLVEELTACVMDTIADALINGTGSEQGTGLETGIAWTKSGKSQNSVEITASGSFTYAKVVEFVGLLKRGYAAGAKMAMNNKTLYNVFYSIVDGNNRPIFIADPKDESIGKVLGFPVVIDDNIADNTVYLGNFSKYLGYNMPEGITIESSRESSFKRGVVDYRALAIADCKPLVDEAFVKLSKATA